MAQETISLTASIEAEEDMYVASCLEIPIASQGATVEEAADHLREAVELWFQTASREEVLEYLPHLGEPGRRVFRTRIEVPIGQIAAHVG
jgi:predicted RNase H-like HicB family nuclease